jgi:hypothetical protein
LAVQQALLHQLLEQTAHGLSGKFKLAR